MVLARVIARRTTTEVFAAFVSRWRDLRSKVVDMKNNGYKLELSSEEAMK